MNKRKLSADPSSLILGIISLVTLFLGCCCGFFVIVALVMSIIGLVLAIKSSKEYQKHPEEFSAQSYKNVTIGKILNISSVALNGLYILVFAIAMLVYQVNFAEGFQEILEEIRNNKNYDDTIIYEETEEDFEDFYIESDSTVIDTVNVK
jgi:uncharacterized membrane protein